MPQTPSPPGGAKPNRIDVHHHILPPAYLLRARERILAISDRDHSALLSWTPARAVEELDKNGIATAMTSLGLPGVWFGGAKAACSLARTCNEYAAQMVKDIQADSDCLRPCHCPIAKAASAKSPMRWTC
jgi:hypothetical protein